MLQAISPKVFLVRITLINHPLNLNLSHRISKLKTCLEAVQYKLKALEDLELVYLKLNLYSEEDQTLKQYNVKVKHHYLEITWDP